MSLQFVLLGILSVTTIGLFIESIIVFNRWKKEIHGYLFLSCITLLINNLGYTLTLKAPNLEAALTAVKFSYLGRTWYAFFLLLFVAQLTHKEISKVIKNLLMLIQAVMYTVIFTMGKHSLYYKDISFKQVNGLSYVPHDNGPVHHLLMGIQVVYIIAGLYLMTAAYMKEKNKTMRNRLGMVLLAVFTESLFFVIEMTWNSGPGAIFDVTILGYFIGTIIMLIAIYTFDLLGTSELAKEYVIDRISEGIIAIDNGGIIRFFNEPAKVLFPALALDSGHVPKELGEAVKNEGTIVINERIYRPEVNELIYEGEVFGDLYALVDETEHYKYTQLIEKEVERQTYRAKRLTREMMLVLSKTVDTKDHYTDGHSRRVASLCAELGRRLGKSDSEQVMLYETGLLHDIGKIGVHEDIINKNSRLSDDEFAAIREHTVKGYEILKEIRDMPALREGARWHHEHYDGTGYPDGLKGEEIPETARITCVSDCYDAMTSTRTYSDPKSQAEVRSEIERCRGTWFDPKIADVMLAMIDEDKNYNLREQNDTGRVWKNYDRLWVKTYTHGE